MGKWYKTGFEEGLSGPNCDPPMQPGHRSHEDYMAGYADGQRQQERNADREDRIARWKEEQ